MPASLSLAEARRVALAAQGFSDPPHSPPTMRTLARTLDRTGVLQIDSVNVLVRAHYMPLYARMGPYDPRLLTRATEARPRRLVEYWAHVAAFMPVDLWPVMRHRMRFHEAHDRWWGSVRARTDVLAAVREGVRDRGPVTARDLDDGAPRRKDNWGWNWSKTKDALEYLFFTGEVAIAGRNGAFERLYDLPERVLPREVVEAKTPAVADANRELVRRAARSHGVVTATCLADYYRMKVTDAKAALADLVPTPTMSPCRRTCSPSIS